MAKKTGNSGRGMARRRTYARGRNIPISDRDALAKLMSESVETRFGGSVARAARETGAPRALLRRVLASSQASVRTDNVPALRRVAGRRKTEVEAMLLAGRPEARLQLYDEWLRASTLAAKNGALQPKVGTLSEIGRRVANCHYIEFVDLVTRLRRDFEDLWKPLDRTLTRRHYQARAELAFARVVAPLVDCFDSAGIERNPDELTESELRAFIKAGVKRECILLKREADPQRAHSAPEPPRYGERFKALFGRYGRLRQSELAAPFDLAGNLPAHTREWLDPSETDIEG